MENQINDEIKLHEFQPDMDIYLKMTYPLNSFNAIVHWYTFIDKHNSFKLKNGELVIGDLGHQIYEKYRLDPRVKVTILPSFLYERDKPSAVVNGEYITCIEDFDTIINQMSSNGKTTCYLYSIKLLDNDNTANKTTRYIIRYKTI